AHIVDPNHQLFELHADETSLNPKFDDVSLDLPCYPRHHLGPLQTSCDIEQCGQTLKFEGCQVGERLFEHDLILVQGRKRLVRLCKQDADILQDVTHRPAVDCDHV